MPSDLLIRSLSAGQWAVFDALLQRILAIGGFLILARILTPADFGVAALLLVVPTFIDGVTAFGFDTAALEKRERMPRYLNPVWTFGVIRGIAIFAIVFATAPWIADFFHIPFAVTALRIAGASVLLSSLGNIGQNFFFLELDFRSIFVRNIAGALTNAIVSIGLAIALHSYWALFLGTIASTAVQAVMTYALHPYRPSFDARFGLFGELRSFTQWFYAQRVTLQVSNTVRDTLIGRFTSPAALGLFGKAQSLVDAPSAYLLNAINRVGFTSYLHARESGVHVAEGLSKTFDLLSFLVFPYVTVILLTGTTIVRILLGESWLDMTPLLKILIFESALDVLIVSIGGPVFNALGRPRVQFLAQATRSTSLVLALVVLIPATGIVGAAVATLISTGLAALVVLYFVFATIPVDYRRILSSAFTALFAGVVPLPLAKYLFGIAFFNSAIGYFAALALCGIVYLVVVTLIGRWLGTGPYRTLEVLTHNFLTKTLGTRVFDRLFLYSTENG